MRILTGSYHELTRLTRTVVWTFGVYVVCRGLRCSLAANLDRSALRVRNEAPVSVFCFALKHSPGADQQTCLGRSGLVGKTSGRPDRNVVWFVMKCRLAEAERFVLDAKNNVIL